MDVIIVTWNGLPLLQKCLPSVLETAYDNFNVIVVDNASSDGTVSWLRENHPDTRILEMTENLGFAEGNNAAIRDSTATYVVLLNNDVEVEPDWLGHLVNRAESDPSIAAVVPKLLQYENRSSFEYAGAAGGHLDRYGYPFARGRLFDTLEIDRGQYDDAADCFWGSGAALLLRCSALDETGLLDPTFFMHMEEIDLCWRLHRAGFRVVCEPAARAYHIGGASLSPRDPQKVFYNFRNSLLMLYKNGGRREWSRRFAVRLILDAVAAIRFVSVGRLRSAFAVLRAYRSAHKMKRSYRTSRPQSDGDIPIYPESIVKAYYLRGKKRFSDLDHDRRVAASVQ